MRRHGATILQKSHHQDPLNSKMVHFLWCRGTTEKHRSPAHPRAIPSALGDSILTLLLRKCIQMPNVMSHSRALWMCINPSCFSQSHRYWHVLTNALVSLVRACSFWAPTSRCEIGFLRPNLQAYWAFGCPTALYYFVFPRLLDMDFLVWCLVTI